MNGLNLLDEARDAGLDVSVDSGLLMVSAPKGAEPIALELIAAKEEILIALDVERALGLQWPVFDLALADCRVLIAHTAKEIVNYARSRWQSEVKGFSPELLASFYVRDLLAGLEAVSPWDGWGDMRAGLDQDRGPTVISRLWLAFSVLPPELQRDVQEAGDLSLSPPACLAVQPDGPRPGGDR